MIDIIIVGGGLSGLIAASNLKHKNKNLNITIIDNNDYLGGRLRQYQKNSYIINEGPSWLWFKDLIENIFKEIGIKDNIDFKELENQYKLIYKKDKSIIVDKNILEKIYNLDPYCKEKLDLFLKNGETNYNLCINKYLKYNNLCISEYFSFENFKNIFKLNMLTSYKTIFDNISKHNIVNKIFIWPSLFIGSKPYRISGLFTILTYYMLKKGTHIPNKKGMIDIVEILEKHLENLGVNIIKNHYVYNLEFKNDKINEVTMINNINNNNLKLNCDYIISSTDYYSFEKMLPNKYRSYTKQYWNKQVMCPSALTFNVVINRKLNNLEYHNLFLINNLNKHINDIFENQSIPEQPLFYVNITSKLFENEVTENHENIFILIPTSNYSNISNDDINYLYQNVIEQISCYTQINLEDHIIFTDFKRDTYYNAKFDAFKNNSYGLSCENYQYAFFRPKIKSKYVNNLYYCGHTSSPGPGIPPSMVSGLNSSNLLLKNIENNSYQSIFQQIMLIITNIIVNIFTYGFNLEGIKNTFVCVKKDICFMLFNKLNYSIYFNYE